MIDNLCVSEDEIVDFLKDVMFYVIDDFVYDFSCGGGWIYVVVVVKEMFGEVEVFVWDFKFNLVCFILVLDVFIFVGELFFG